jgi:hypothetical protein
MICIGKRAQRAAKPVANETQHRRQPELMQLCYALTVSHASLIPSLPGYTSIKYPEI